MFWNMCFQWPGGFIFSVLEHETQTNVVKLYLLDLEEAQTSIMHQINHDLLQIKLVSDMT